MLKHLAIAILTVCILALLANIAILWVEGFTWLRLLILLGAIGGTVAAAESCILHVYRQRYQNRRS